MGNHRGARRSTSRSRSERPAEGYVGRRVAGRADTPETPDVSAREVTAHPVVPATVEIPAVFTNTTSDSLRPAVPGKRRAAKSPRVPVLRGLPSMPVAVGVAVLAVSAGGVLSTNGTQLAAGGDGPARVAAPNAASGEIGAGVYDALGRSPVVSRDSDRDALDDASDASLVQEVEAQAEQRNEALGDLAVQAEKEAKTINSNRWSLPIDPGVYQLSATFGQAGSYWSSGYHTGLDFAAPSGTPIMAVASGVVTSTGYEGAYGNQTVVTLEDGTEIWYNHQTSYAVSVGDNVVAGQVIGTVGSTGNSTGPHLHLEVRPGGGDPVDPFAALVVNGVNP
ncbi:peptidoglycan DD-metalloendopeptidase family protein [Nocardioides sp. HM23]|uniref:peptidoglycan DD-metalloendopeptidase family protein n=1 Tax=Nocardioides bizhenqiangii TaxID=3095076 RepID=UPI002ACB0105|nr:peptidoglycan DD-metalloendopeptidase family protein [Nocardioides sp. HM23]MDZ5621488.1 peptidoglycan DD-metalloendopeptidase family protein [Nocardioides sp. HM23]